MFPLKDNIPTERFPLVTVALILANALVFVLFQHPTGFDGVDNAKVIDFGAIPYELSHPGQLCVFSGQIPTCGPGGDTQPATWVTVLSSMFMHGGVLHIAGNMLFLWIFGNNVEDSMGRVRFLAFYLLGGAAALLGQVLVDPNAMAPTIGASGAVAAVLGGYLLLFPRAKVLTVIFIVIFFTVIEIPAIFLLAFWFVQQLFFGSVDLARSTGSGGGVAYFAHVGGFVFGLVLIRLFARRARSVPAPRAAY